MDISLNSTPQQTSDLKIGWDFLIDIDSKYFDYSKIAAELLIKAFEYHGVKNIGIKFSGSKGLHIIIPWKAFPKEYAGEETRTKFPEWPRAIAGYIHEFIKDKLNQKILEMSNKSDLEKKGEIVREIKCKKCHSISKNQKVSKYRCKNQKCKSEMTSMKSVRKTLRCPSCQYDMEKIGEEELIFCDTCKLNSKKNPENFELFETTKSQQDSVDFVLVAPRHLFRAPYSLHEKTALASVVLDKSELENFSPSMADPFKIKIKNYTPDCQEGEARELLAQALDWENKKEKDKKRDYSKFEGKSIDVKNLTIEDSMFPECIKKILSGQKQDGRKRALFVLLSFLRSLQLPNDYVAAKVYDWNKKNYQPLKDGYINSQIDWSEKNRLMPPNCNSHYYKELGIACNCSGIKNPINYTIKLALRAKGKSFAPQTNEKNKNKQARKSKTF
jgi:DNA primase catalytic subunit